MNFLSLLFSPKTKTIIPINTIVIKETIIRSIIVFPNKLFMKYNGIIANKIIIAIGLIALFKYSVNDNLIIGLIIINLIICAIIAIVKCTKNTDSGGKPNLSAIYEKGSINNKMVPTTL